MQLIVAAAVLVIATDGSMSSQEDALPTRQEIIQTMEFVGLPPATPPPEIRLLPVSVINQIGMTPYIENLGLETTELYEPDIGRITLRDDWRTHSGMPDFVHEMKHYKQSVDHEAYTDPGTECEAYKVENEYEKTHGYPTLDSVIMMSVLSCDGQFDSTPIVLIPPKPRK